MVPGFASGEDAQEGPACKAFLTALEPSQHRLVFSPALWAEWERHAGGRERWGRKWWVRMVERERIHFVSPAPDVALRDALRETAPNEDAADEALKDAHLAEAAHETDMTIVSHDIAAAAGHFPRAAAVVAWLWRIVWFDPVMRPADEAQAWLRNGAKARQQYRLGYGRR